jgi:hypothetical protein
MVDRAFNEVALDPNYSYQTFVAKFDRIVANELLKHQRPRVLQPYDVSVFHKKFKKKLKKAVLEIILAYYGRLPGRLRLIIKVIGGSKIEIDRLSGI